MIQFDEHAYFSDGLGNQPTTNVGKIVDWLKGRVFFGGPFLKGNESSTPTINLQGIFLRFQGG